MKRVSPFISISTSTIEFYGLCNYTYSTQNNGWNFQVVRALLILIAWAAMSSIYYYEWCSWIFCNRKIICRHHPTLVSPANTKKVLFKLKNTLNDIYQTARIF